MPLPRASLRKANLNQASLIKASLVKLYFVDRKDRATIGSRIRQLRERNELTQEEFGQRLGGIAWMQISRYERGNALPRVETLVRMKGEFDVSLDWLLTGNGEPAVPGRPGTTE